MKSVLVIVAAVMLVGCSPAEVPSDSQGRIKNRGLSEVCVNGVVYYATYSHYGNNYTPKFKPDSTVETCE
jgi:hypothetical protein